MKADIVISIQAGDEGKGKIFSYINNSIYDICARGGGPNAGHTIYNKGVKYGLRMLPSGVFGKSPRLLLGPGTLVSANAFLKEVEQLKLDPQRVGIDRNATLITEDNVKTDALNGGLIGTTKTGCGPAMSDKVNRIAPQVSTDERLLPYICDTVKEINAASTVIVEGCQGFELSLFHGDYPYVTSRDTTASGFCSELGIGPRNVRDVYAVMKSYTTRVGNGPLIGEMSHEDAKKRGWDEYGTVTGRARRVSEVLDFERLHRAVQVNSANQIALTKLDARFPTIKSATKYSDLSSEARKFVSGIERELGLTVTLIGTGPNTEDIIDRR